MDGHSEYSRQVARGSFFNLLGSAVFYLSSFFYTIIIARAVSQEDLGIFFLAMSIINLPAVFDNLGLASSVVRYVPYYEGRKEQGKIRSLLKISYAGVSLSATLLMAILWLSSDFIGELYKNPVLPEAVRTLSLLLLLTNVLNLGTAYIRSRADMKRSQLVQNIQNALKVVFTLAAITAFGPGIFALSIGLLASFVPSILLSFYYVWKKTKDLPAKEDSIPLSTVVTEIIPFGLMLGLVTSLSALFLTTSRALLGYLTPPSESALAVALFSVSSTLASVQLNIPISVGGIFLPIISRLFGKGDLEAMRSVTNTAQRWTMLMTIPAAMLMVLFSSDLLYILYGEKYVDGALILGILAAGLQFKVAYFMLSMTLSAMRRVKVQLVFLVLSGILNVSMNIILIPMLGPVGSALASTASLFLGIVLYLRYAHRHLSYSLPPEIYKISASGIVALALTYFALSQLSPLLPRPPAGDHLLSGEGAAYLAYLCAASMAALAIFAVLVMALKCLKKDDVSLMRRVLSKVKAPGPAMDLFEKVASRGISP